MSATAIDFTRPDLRRLVAAQLPERVERFCRRGRRLSTSGWDVNVMALLIDDANLLAGLCRVVDTEALAARIEALRDAMHLLLADIDPPDSRAASEIAGLVADVAAETTSRAAPGGDLGEFADDADDTPGMPTDEETAADDRCLPDARTASGAPRHADAGSGTSAATPPPALSATAPATSVRAAGRLRVLHVTRGDAFADAVDGLLTAHGENVSRYASSEAALQEADPSVPTLLLVDNDFAADLAPIEAALRRLRAKGGERIVVVALSTRVSTADRVHALRIGCDALIELPASAETVVERVRQQVQMLQGEPYRVLIVEDDSAQARFADSILSSAGMQTRIVANALDTIDEINLFRPDLVLMDLYMPDCDGIELTTLIRQRPSNASISILFLSGERNAGKHLDALKAGGDDFLAKPVQPRQLINAVSSRIHRSRMHAQRAPASASAPPRVVAPLQLMRRLSELIADNDARAGIGGLIAMRPPAANLDPNTLPTIAAFVARKANTRDIVTVDNARGLLVIAEDCASAFLEAYALGLREAVAAEHFGDHIASSNVFDIGTCAFDAGVISADGMRAVAIAAITGADVSAIEPLAAATEALAAGDDASENRIVDDIRSALDGGGFSLLFQPIVSLRGDEEEQFQALLRLQGRSGSVYSAAQIVPVAERAALMDAIDRWTLENAIAMLAARARKGRAARMIVSQSLQGHGRDALDVAALRDRLQRHDVDAAALALDFRASDLAANRSAAERPFAEMRALGIRLALAAVDDVEKAGVLLAAIKFDYVRLGPRFAQIEIESVRDDLRELVKRAHERGARVIAPRIEDARGAATMWTLGIDYIQGHFVQRPDSSLAFDFQASVM